VGLSSAKKLAHPKRPGFVSSDTNPDLQKFVAKQVVAVGRARPQGPMGSDGTASPDYIFIDNRQHNPPGFESNAGSARAEIVRESARVPHGFSMGLGRCTQCLIGSKRPKSFAASGRVEHRGERGGVVEAVPRAFPRCGSFSQRRRIDAREQHGLEHWSRAGAERGAHLKVPGSSSIHVESGENRIPPAAVQEGHRAAFRR
jgi:hypothetical protein